jgi:hypothetical protein
MTGAARSATAAAPPLPAGRRVLAPLSLIGLVGM